MDASQRQQAAQLSQRDYTAGWVSFGQKWTTIFCRHYRSIFNHCDTTELQSYQIQWKKTQNKYCSFKIIKVGINWKPVCDFLLEI